MHYFAYGSNCSADVLERKQVRFRSRARATLRDHQLRFNKKALRESLPDTIGFANVEPADGHTVEGVLYDIVEDDLERLDASERHPDHYERTDVVVESADGAVPCFTYRARADKTADGLVPSRNYLNHIIAARDFLSLAYFEALERSQTYEAPCTVCTSTREVVFLREGGRLWTLCQPCREARVIWGTTRGRDLTVAETAAVMQLVHRRGGFESIRELIDEAVATRTIDP